MSDKVRKRLEVTVVCTTFLALTVLILITSARFRQKLTTVRIDDKGTPRLGEVLPLREKSIRDVTLKTLSGLNGGKLDLVVDKGASFKRVVEVMDSIASPKTNKPPAGP